MGFNSHDTSSHLVVTVRALLKKILRPQLGSGRRVVQSMTCTHGETYRWHKTHKLKRQPKRQNAAWKGKHKVRMGVWTRTRWLATQIRRWQKATSKGANKNQANGQQGSPQGQFHTFFLASDVWSACLCPLSTKQGHLKLSEIWRKASQA